MSLSQKEADIQMMLAAQCHLGTKNCNYQMERYVWRRRQDGIYIINLAKTWEKLFLAARVIVAIENPADIVVMSARPYGQRAVLKFAHHTGAKAIAGRHTPGTFTNQQEQVFEEPRLLILTDPFTDHQPIKESAYVNMPTIAFCGTDSPLGHVDIAIPTNNKARHSIGCMYYMLARMVLQMRGRISPENPWDVMVDMFFYREPEDTKEEDEAPVVVAEVPAVPADFAVPAAPVAEWDEKTQAAFVDQGFPQQVQAGDWSAQQQPGQGWDQAAPPQQMPDFGMQQQQAPPQQPMGAPMDFGQNY